MNCAADDKQYTHPQVYPRNSHSSIFVLAPSFK